MDDPDIDDGYEGSDSDPEPCWKCSGPLCEDCTLCHTCDKDFIEHEQAEEYPCYPNHPYTRPEMRLPEGM